MQCSREDELMVPPPTSKTLITVHPPHSLCASEDGHCWQLPSPLFPSLGSHSADVLSHSVVVPVQSEPQCSHTFQSPARVPPTQLATLARRHSWLSGPTRHASVSYACLGVDRQRQAVSSWSILTDARWEKEKVQ